MVEGVVIFLYKHDLNDEQVSKIIKAVMFENGIIQSVHNVGTDNFLVVTFNFLKGDNKNTAEAVATNFITRISMFKHDFIHEWAELLEHEETRLNTNDLKEVFKS